MPRPLPADSELVQAIAVLARAQQDVDISGNILLVQVLPSTAVFFRFSPSSFQGCYCVINGPPDVQDPVPDTIEYIMVVDWREIIA
jgi:hypothetical protein